jgi:hypothetical protein
VKLVKTFESIFIYGLPYSFSASFKINMISLEFPYRAHLVEIVGTGFSIANLQQPAKNYSSVIKSEFSSLDMHENIYALIFEILPG